ncbi:MAG: TonB-dependent receptor [Pseudomonadota bacterium]|nr:TonB-dependent receptor [Pseudomonadota bacterium]
MNQVDVFGLKGTGAKLLASVSMLALGGLAASPAAAQETTTAAEEQAPPADETQQATETGDDIVVTARRRALQAAEQRKKNSEGIIDSVVADEAGKLPDNSITEVLQRVSGVSIVRFAALNDPDHFSVEGSGIQVRGLTGVASRLNGRDIFSANGGRSLLWGDVTPELMAAVDVYKAATADLIEGGTGGQIDLRTKLPFDFSKGWHLAGSVEGSKGDLAKSTDYGGSILVSNRFDTNIGEIGFLVDVAHSRLTSRSNFFRTETYYAKRLLGETEDVFIPGGYDYGDEEFARDRTGLYGALQWAPNDDLTLTGIFFQSKYKNKNKSRFAMQTSQDLIVDRLNSVFDDNGHLLSSESLFIQNNTTFLPTNGTITGAGGAEGTTSKSMTRDWSFDFDWNPGGGPLKIGGAYQHIKSTSDLRRLAIFRDVNFPSTFGLDLTGDFPEVDLPATDEFFENPANYFWAAAMPHEEKNRGKMDALNLDAEYTFEDSFFRSVKGGVRWSNRKERDLNNGFTWSALGRGWNGDPQLTFANAAPGDVEFYEFDNFFHGDIDVPANLMFPTIDLVRNADVDELHQAPPAGFCGPAFSSALWWNCSAAGPLADSTYGGPRSRTGHFLLPNDLREWSTKNIAGYALVRFGRDYVPGTLGFSGNVGLRLVKLKNESLGYITQNGTTFLRNGVPVTLASVAVARGGSKSFTRLLPSVNLQLQPHEDIKARFAFSKTMDLPTFDALRGSAFNSVVTSRNPACPAVGNCNLIPVFSNFTTEAGNPFLKPTMSRNLDLSFEWYPKPGTTAHLALFHKRISNLPVRSLTQRDVTFFFTDGTSEEVSAAATDVQNAEVPAKVKGFEVGGRTFLDMLPGLLSGFGVEANYTFIDSKNPGDLYRDIYGNIRNDAPLQGMSRHNANVTLLYEKGRVSARVAYSWRSKYLQSVNANGTNAAYTFYHTPGVNTGGEDAAQFCARPNPFCQRIQTALPVYGAAYGQVDAGITFKVNENLSLTAQGSNLLNETQKTLMGGYKNDRLYTRSWFQSDRRFSVGANFAF